MRDSARARRVYYGREIQMRLKVGAASGATSCSNNAGFEDADVGRILARF